MDRKLKRWEAALMMGVAISLVLGSWLQQEQRDLADRVVRLHVIANSDSEADQALKLQVRDRVLQVAETLCPPGTTREEFCEALEQKLPELEAEGERTVRDAGGTDPVRACLERTWFPTKQYGDFALPAGEYTALRVVIGEGNGHNWWCVAFPPLCLGAASETVEQAAQAGNFSQEQTKLITGDGDGYVLKFRTMELLGELRGLFRAGS